MKYLFLVLITTFISCQRNTLSKQKRIAYLEEHVENINYMTNFYFNEFEIYRLIYRDTRNYEKFKNAVEACRQFEEYLNEDAYLLMEKSSLTKRDWETVIEKQEYATQQIDNIKSLFLSRIARHYVLEKIHPDDSDELKLAKYYSNCERLIYSLYNSMEYTKNHYGGKLSEKFSLLTPHDTISYRDSLFVSAGICVQENIRQSIIINKMVDCKLTHINFKTGKFDLEITGNNPQCVFSFYDSFKQNDVMHEIVF
jgi:hypothetical protein